MYFEKWYNRSASNKKAYVKVLSLYLSSQENQDNVCTHIWSKLQSIVLIVPSFVDEKEI